jgi:hypothetical protein
VYSKNITDELQDENLQDAIYSLFEKYSGSDIQNDNPEMDRLKNISQGLKLSYTFLQLIYELYVLKKKATFPININDIYKDEIIPIVKYVNDTFIIYNNDNIYKLALFGRMMFSKAGLKNKTHLIDLFPNINKTNIDNIRKLAKTNKGINIIFGYGTEDEPNIIRYKLKFEYIGDIITLGTQLKEIIKPEGETNQEKVGSFMVTILKYFLPTWTIEELKMEKFNFSKLISDLKNIVEAIYNLKSECLKISNNYDYISFPVGNTLIGYFEDGSMERINNKFHDNYYKYLNEERFLEILQNSISKSKVNNKVSMSYFKKSINSILVGNIKCFNDIINLFVNIEKCFESLISYTELSNRVVPMNE